MLTREVIFPVPAATLWEALTDPDAVSGWMGAEVDWDLAPGGRARFRHPADGDRAGRVEAVEPGRRLSFRWWPVADRSDESEVSWELEPTGDGTRLTVTEQRVTDRRVTATPDIPAVKDAASADVGSWTACDGRLLGLWAVAARAGATR